MALNKNITLENGVQSNYHRIGTISKNKDILNVTVQSYISQEYREKSSDYYVDVRYYTFHNSDENVSFHSIYELLKNHEDFQGAEDI